jgi:hypothetical protein
MTEAELKSCYDSGYVNALLQLRGHIKAIVDKPNSQTKTVFMLMDTMLKLNEETK